MVHRGLGGSHEQGGSSAIHHRNVCCGGAAAEHARSTQRAHGHRSGVDSGPPAHARSSILLGWVLSEKNVQHMHDHMGAYGEHMHQAVARGIKFRLRFSHGRVFFDSHNMQKVRQNLIPRATA